jgi:HprK-related kinase A
MTTAMPDTGAIDRALRRDGLHLRLGPFVTRIRGDAPDIAAHLASIYAHHGIDADAWAESTVSVRLVRDRKRPWRRLAQLLIDERPFMPPLAARLSAPMLEWGLNWVIASRAHQFLLLHAAALEKNGRVAILAATSGSGKSTLCTLLAANGWRMFSDEFAVLRLGDGMALPMPRAVSLKNQSIGLAKALFPGGLFTIDFTHTVKGTLAFMQAPKAAVLRDQEPARPGLVVFPRYVAGSRLEVTPVGKAATFTGLVENSMNYAALGARGFGCVADLVENAPGWSVTYGDNAEMLRWFDDTASAFG